MYLVRPSRSKTELDQISLDAKITALRKLHVAGRLDNDLLALEWLEDVFAAHATSSRGLAWRVLDLSLHGRSDLETESEQLDPETKSEQLDPETEFEQTDPDTESKPDVDVRLIKFEQSKVETEANFAEMEADTLYYRIDPHFPFFDGVWKSNEVLCAFQATTSKTHPKRVSSFIAALGRIGIPDVTKLTSIVQLCSDAALL